MSETELPREFLHETELERKIFLGFVRLHILHHAAQDEVFGMELMEELGSHGYSLSPGTLYPILHHMEDGGYLNSRKEVVGGKTRKYYSATSAGRSMLEGAKDRLRELSDEILGGRTNGVRELSDEIPGE
jgi:DNA-binding PadR family transcriptional regulator